MANEELKRRKRRVSTIWIVAAGAAIVAIVLAMLPRATEADFVVLDTGTVRVELIDEGRTRMHDVYVISAPVAGRVMRVEVEPGDKVESGTVVARMASAPAGFLDSRTELQARAAVEAAEASMRSAQAELSLAESDLERSRALVVDRLIPQSVFDNSQTRATAARAARDAAQAEIARARSALLSAERTTSGLVEVRAPVSGSVLRVPQESEAVIAVGTPIIELGDPAHVEVVAEFLSQDAVRMRPGNAARIENWGGAPLAAVVERIEPVARTKISALGVEEQRTNVILQFADREAATGLGHDFRVDAHVIIDEARDVVRAPLGALFRNGDQWSTYQVVEGKAVLTPVEVGVADSNYRAITKGVAAGDTVIVFPASTIAEGTRVRARGS